MAKNHGRSNGIFEHNKNPRKLEILCTSYCGCGHCCAWEWGLTLPGDRYLALGDLGAPKGTKHPLAPKEGIDFGNFKLAMLHPDKLFPKNLKVKARKPSPSGLKPSLFCRYWTSTGQLGRPYTGVTSTGNFPAQARPPLLSTAQLSRFPERVVLRSVMPWLLLPRTGTIAADTTYFPFGTKMLVPGYGWAQVDDHGGAVKGQLHVDLFHHNHHDALEWGKRKVNVMVVPPGKHVLDQHLLPKPIEPVAKALHFVWSMFCGVHP